MCLLAADGGHADYWFYGWFMIQWKILVVFCVYKHVDKGARPR